jgi:hypothetical protein
VNLGLEFVGCIDHHRRPKPTRLVRVRVANSRDDAGATTNAELGDKPSNHPGGARHQHDTTFAHPGRVKEESG